MARLIKNASRSDAYSIETPVVKVRSQALGLGTVSLLVLVAFLWALCFPLINIGLSSAPPLKFAGLRALIAGVTVLLLAFGMRQALPRGWRVWLLLAVVAFGATTLGFFGMFIGGARVAPGLATVIENTQPLIATTLAWLVLGESLGQRRRVGLLLGFGGILVISLPRFLDTAASSGSGIAILLVSAIGVALANVTLKSLAGKVDVLMAVGWQLLLGSVPLLVAGLLFEQQQAVHWDGMFLFVLLILSLLGTAAASVLWFFLLRRAALGRLNTFMFLTPVFGLLLSLVLFGERFNAWEIAGTALVLSGVWQMTRSTTDVYGNTMTKSEANRSSEDL
jgi:drug/metabolite transporter (DMT)-like permease